MKASQRNYRLLIKRPKEVMNGCVGKVRLPSRKVATARARKLNSLLSDNMQAYHCRACGRWHIGHS